MTKHKKKNNKQDQKSKIISDAITTLEKKLKDNFSKNEVAEILRSIGNLINNADEGGIVNLKKNINHKIIKSAQNKNKEELKLEIIDNLCLFNACNKIYEIDRDPNDTISRKTNLKKALYNSYNKIPNLEQNILESFVMDDKNLAENISLRLSNIDNKSNIPVQDLKNQLLKTAKDICNFAGGETGSFLHDFKKSIYIERAKYIHDKILNSDHNNNQALGLELEVFHEQAFKEIEKNYNLVKIVYKSYNALLIENDDSYTKYSDKLKLMYEKFDIACKKIDPKYNRADELISYNTQYSKDTDELSTDIERFLLSDIKGDDGSYIEIYLLLASIKCLHLRLDNNLPHYIKNRQINAYCEMFLNNVNILLEKKNNNPTFNSSEEMELLKIKFEENVDINFYKKCDIKFSNNQNLSMSIKMMDIYKDSDRDDKIDKMLYYAEYAYNKFTNATDIDTKWKVNLCMLDAYISKNQLNNAADCRKRMLFLIQEYDDIKNIPNNQYFLELCEVLCKESSSITNDKERIISEEETLLSSEENQNSNDGNEWRRYLSNGSRGGNRENVNAI